MTGMTMFATVRVDAAHAAALEHYEDTVLALLPEYDITLLRRERSADGRLEAHLVTFASLETVDAYDVDPRRAAARTALADATVEAVRYVLDPSDGPEGIVLWQARAQESVAVLLEEGQTLADVDLLHVADVLLEADEVVEAARALARPGLPADAPLDDPELTFYPGDEWVLRFADGGDGGPVVLFRGREPQRVEALDEGEELA